MQSVRYEIDPYNRIVIAGSGTANDLPKFRQALDGRFQTDENNDLSYLIRAPLSEDENIPNQIDLRGKWSLTDDHELRLTLDKLGRKTFGDQITLEGEILDVNKDSLLFAVTTVTKEDTLSTYVLNLGGVWKADENNRLSFHVRKEGGKYDILTFSGAWEVNKNNQIIYNYERADLIRKKSRTHTLLFKGYWDIKEKLRISYILSADTDSVFTFNAGVGIFKEGYIKYELDIGLSASAQPLTRAITLSGRWNLKKDVGLIFEIEYENKDIRRIVFGADAVLTDKDTVLFKLKDDVENKDIGATLELSHEILEGEGEVFLRALLSRRELAVYAGAAWRW